MPQSQQLQPLTLWRVVVQRAYGLGSVRTPIVPVVRHRRLHTGLAPSGPCLLSMESDSAMAPPHRQRLLQSRRPKRPG
jgi:hypothetical protein